MAVFGVGLDLARSGHNFHTALVGGKTREGRALSSLYHLLDHRETFRFGHADPVLRILRPPARSSSATQQGSSVVEGAADQKTCLIMARPGSVIDPHVWSGRASSLVAAICAAAIALVLACDI